MSRTEAQRPSRPTRRRASVWALVLLAVEVAAVLAVAEAPSGAAASDTYEIHTIEVACTLTATDGSHLDIRLGADLVGTWPVLDNDAVLYDSHGVPVAGSIVGPATYGQGTIANGFAMVRQTDGQDLGPLQLSGVLTPSGAPVVTTFGGSSGNRHSKGTFSVQQLGVAPSLSLPDAAELDPVREARPVCHGTEIHVLGRETNPNTQLQVTSGSSAWCPIDENRYLTFQEVADQPTVTISFGADASTGTWDLLAAGDVTVVDSSITGSVPVLAGAGVGSSVVVDLTVGPSSGRTRDHIKFPYGSSYRVHDQLFPVTGTLRLPSGEVIAVPECQLDDFTAVSQYKPKVTAHQDAGGKPPANDLPTAAITLGPGGEVSARNRGAAELPEAPCLGDTSDEVGRTVWYRFTGTGGMVHLTTAKSTTQAWGHTLPLDTELGVYRADLTLLACNDDPVPGVYGPAELAVPTVAGATYYLQVGGWAGTWGTIVLDRD